RSSHGTSLPIATPSARSHRLHIQSTDSRLLAAGHGRRIHPRRRSRRPQEALMSQQTSPSNARSSRGLMRPVNHFLERWVPSALVFAIVLTLIVAVLALFL